ncbi:MAG: tetratricopeptide repeat protein [Thermoguttaceae bacterium]|nr:tetratricopeptide repeat protein [Thermoguttaceae bacterium]
MSLGAGSAYRNRWIWVGAVFLVLASACQTPEKPVPLSQGHALYYSGHYERAIDFLEREITFRPSAEGYYLLGASYARLAERRADPIFISRAEQALRACLERDPEHDAAYYELCGLLVRDGRVAEARQLLESWAARSPHRAEPRVQLARLEWLTGNRSAAEDELIEALKLDPKNPRALAALGMIREQAGLLAQAEHNYRQSLRYDPTQPEVASRLARLNPPSSPDGTVSQGHIRQLPADRSGWEPLRR